MGDRDKGGFWPGLRWWQRVGKRWLRYIVLIGLKIETVSRLIVWFAFASTVGRGLRLSIFFSFGQRDGFIYIEAALTWLHLLIVPLHFFDSGPSSLPLFYGFGHPLIPLFVDLMLSIFVEIVISLHLYLLHILFFILRMLLNLLQGGWILVMILVIIATVVIALLIDDKYIFIIFTHGVVWLVIFQI